MSAHVAGISGTFEQVIRFIDWADSHQSKLTWQAICDHWGVSRATGYRWLSAYRAARGLA